MLYADPRAERAGGRPWRSMAGGAGYPGAPRSTGALGNRGPRKSVFFLLACVLIAANFYVFNFQVHIGLGSHEPPLDMEEEGEVGEGEDGGVDDVEEGVGRGEGGAEVGGMLPRDGGGVSGNVMMVSTSELVPVTHGAESSDGGGGAGDGHGGGAAERGGADAIGTTSGGASRVNGQSAAVAAARAGGATPSKAVHVSRGWRPSKAG